MNEATHTAAEQRIQEILGELQDGADGKKSGYLAISALQNLQARALAALESVDYWDRYIDPRDRYMDPGSGELWSPVGTGGDRNGAPPSPLVRDLADLARVRGTCRRLAALNPYAISAHQNRQSYIVGTGLTWTVSAKDSDSPAGKSAAKRAQGVLDDFLLSESWAEYEEEFVLRADRDGEVFLRFYGTEFRIEEPEDCTPPDARAEAAPWGVEHAVGDAQKVVGYYFGGKLVPAAQVEHLKFNVDRNVDRGLPTFYPGRVHLDRALKLLRNLSILAQVQAAFAVIRRWDPSAMRKSQAEALRANSADWSRTSSVTGKTEYHQRLPGGGVMIDVPNLVEYQFPQAGSPVEPFIEVLRAELRTVAAMTNQPEFMFSADANQAHYSSSVVAQGPAHKRFSRDQARVARFEERALWRVIPERDRPLVRLTWDAPPIAPLDAKEETERNAILEEHGVLSVETWSAREDLDYEAEQASIAKHDADVYPDVMPEGDGDGEATSGE